MIYQAYHSNREAIRIIRAAKIAATIILIAIISYVMGYSTHAEEETIAIIYSGGLSAPEHESESVVKIEDENLGKSAEIGIAPGTENNDVNLRESTQESTQAIHEYSGITMTASEREELRRVVAAEAQNQSFNGRKAVVEVIFNRVLSKEWPSSVHSVLSQKGQFATYKLRNQKWVEPKYADAAIDAVLSQGRTVLPSTKYFFFDTKGINGSGHIKIGGHYFGK